LPRYHTFYPLGTNYFTPAAGYATTYTGTVHFWLLPFLEQQTLMQEWNTTKKSSDTIAGNTTEGNDTHTPSVYVCPSDPSMPTTTLGPNGYAVSSYSFNNFVFNTQASRIPATFSDGLSQTAFVFERYSVCGPPPATSGDVRVWGTPPSETVFPSVRNSRTSQCQQRPIPSRSHPAPPPALPQRR
jgi:hypothetical protein